MKQDIYIDSQGSMYGIEPSQQHLIKPEWTLCEKKQDGSNADYYNTDGTIAPDPDPTEEEVKREANRRIVAICPEWKQRNYIATDLTFTKIIQAGGTLTTEQQAARTEMESVWTSIQGIRTKSDEIEAMTPIPQDFTNDTYWT